MQRAGALQRGEHGELTVGVSVPFHPIGAGVSRADKQPGKAIDRVATDVGTFLSAIEVPIRKNSSRQRKAMLVVIPMAPNIFADTGHIERGALAGEPGRC
ncbi:MULTISPECIES: hypothetical protein [unclassified Mesorhizobium]|uniref:hypothetical protein n=1 Tax=unclassified Mesorhizobium TaxID=325217 RepID=UPI00163DB0FB|nr:MULTISPECIES: hypothetical protein [unclassified Mesorhizobium]